METTLTKHSENLSRIVDMQGGDPGFFLLATHSYVENYIREKYGLFGIEYSFPDLLYQFRQDKIKKADGFIEGLDVINIIKSKQEMANCVRHRFGKIDPDEAVAAAYRLIQFCRLTGIECPDQIKRIEESLEIWNERECSWDRHTELKNIKWELFKTKRKNKEILDEIDELKKNRIESDHIAAQIRVKETEIERLKSRNEDKAERVDALRKQKFELECEKKKSDARIIELESANQYISNLSRLSNYTRTRFDFERDITRLTKEQQRIIDAISLRDDFLIKGGAGTGKTLVLIKALEKALDDAGDELDFGQSANVKLLTYNNTLAKYDKYLAQVMKHEEQAEMIGTVDTYIKARLRIIDPSYEIPYGNYIDILTHENNTTGFLSDNELKNEIENFIFAKDISREEYIDEMIPRKGLKKPLTAAQREKIWEVRSNIIKAMTEQKRFTKNYSRRVILDYLDNNPGDKALVDTDFIFIDEVQDLCPVDLRVLKACTTRAVIMAGDSDQSIYQPGFTFSRGNIDIRGTARILRTNFRNTVEIHELAEKYRSCSENIDTETQPEAFRLGPLPELFQGDDKDELVSMMIRRINIFIDDLGYDPENIGILVPTNKDADALNEALGAAGYDSANLKDSGFSFSSRGRIRVSTLHSSKGLDFPIVLLFLYKEPFTGFFYDDETRHKMTRNLIYVSMTRAMDHLNIFTLDKENKPPVDDLVRLMLEEGEG